MIDVAKNFSSSSFIIMTDQKIIINWFIDFFFEKIHIVFSNVNFIFEKIVIKFLKHYIKHSHFSKKSKWKLMFMNNHDNHMTSEFVLLINEHNIRFFAFIFHLTHCMQSLDVRIFRQYKHWHQRTIQKTVAKSFVEYSLNQFLKNLTKIRFNIFKLFTIRHFFQNSKMWSVNAKRCIEQLKIFSFEFFKKKLTLFSYLFRHFYFQ